MRESLAFGHEIKVKVKSTVRKFSFFFTIHNAILFVW